MRLNATKQNDTVIISQNCFEHLLDCLDKQKYVPLTESQTDHEKRNIQYPIDDFNIQCRELLDEK